MHERLLLQDEGVCQSSTLSKALNILFSPAVKVLNRLKAHLALSNR